MSRTPIRPERLVRRVAEKRSGAVALFLGTVREERGARGRLRRLDYEAYGAQAAPRLRTVAREAVRRWGARAVAIEHRVGPVPVGEAAVGVAAAAVHREEAFRACRWALDEVKRSAAVWKREVGTRGEGWQAGGTPLEPEAPRSPRPRRTGARKERS